MFRKHLATERIPKKARLVRPYDVADTVTPEDRAIIADVAPGFEGALLIRMLRTLSPNAKLIALTSREDKAFADELKLSGANSVLRKPINTGFILALLGRRERRKQSSDKTVQINHFVRSYLNKYKIPVRSKGFAYICAALEFMLADSDRMNCFTLTSDIYPELERRYGVCAANAERDIRYVIERYIRPSVGKKTVRFGGKVTTSSFIWTFAMKISVEAARAEASKNAMSPAKNTSDTNIL